MINVFYFGVQNYKEIRIIPFQFMKSEKKNILLHIIEPF